jgi:flagellar basal-body rod modification protein FlgD
MTTVNATDTTNPLATLGAQTSARKTDETEDRFLKLLISQLKNQDPLNPLANSEVTTQLAQINTVKGLEKLNDTLQGLVGQVSAGQSLQAAALVGRRVIVAGDALALSGGQAAAGFELAEPVDQLTVTIKDSSGLIIHTAELGSHDAGLHLFAWDGIADSGQAAAEGTYRFEISANKSGRSVTADRLSIGRVDGVLPGTDGTTTLNLGGLAPVSYSQVRQIL